MDWIDEKWLVDCFKKSLGGTEKTASGYANGVHRFFRWCRANEIENPDPFDFERWHEEHIESDRNGVTGIRRFFDWCEYNGYYPDITTYKKNSKNKSKRNAEENLMRINRKERRRASKMLGMKGYPTDTTPMKDWMELYEKEFNKPKVEPKHKKETTKPSVWDRLKRLIWRKND